MVGKDKELIHHPLNAEDRSTQYCVNRITVHGYTCIVVALSCSFSPLQVAMVTSMITPLGGSCVMRNCTRSEEEQVKFEDSYLEGPSIKCFKTDYIAIRCYC